jgi:hypothetical protein
VQSELGCLDVNNLFHQQRTAFPVVWFYQLRITRDPPVLAMTDELKHDLIQWTLNLIVNETPNELKEEKHVSLSDAPDTYQSDSVFKQFLACKLPINQGFHEHRV